MIQTGDIVTLIGLSTRDLNGTTGIIFHLNVKPGRHCVCIGEKKLSIKEVNMFKEGEKGVCRSSPFLRNSDLGFLRSYELYLQSLTTEGLVKMLSFDLELNYFPRPPKLTIPFADRKAKFDAVFCILILFQSLHVICCFVQMNPKGNRKLLADLIMSASSVAESDDMLRLCQAGDVLEALQCGQKEQ